MNKIIAMLCILLSSLTASAGWLPCVELPHNKKICPHDEVIYFDNLPAEVIAIAQERGIPSDQKQKYLFQLKSSDPRMKLDIWVEPELLSVRYGCFFGVCVGDIVTPIQGYKDFVSKIPGLISKSDEKKDVVYKIIGFNTFTNQFIVYRNDYPYLDMAFSIIRSNFVITRKTLKYSESERAN